MQAAIPCSLMRGGTSKGLFFVADQLPEEPTLRDRILLAAMGSPDERQIDGVGGAHPLTSKIAIVKPSTHPDADVDYLFLQVSVDQSLVSGNQNCGNMLAGVGPFAIEQGLITPTEDETFVRIHMVNTGGIAIAKVQTPRGNVEYNGAARIDGVPGTAAPILLEFLNIAGSSCGQLLPTGNAIDQIDGIDVTCIDNGMPVVLIRAQDLGKTGYETPQELESDEPLKQRIESIRLQLGEIMNLGDVSQKTVPKISLIAAPQHNGAICTRTFIPHRVHEAIGVLGAASVATACILPGTVAQSLARVSPENSLHLLDVEHPTGFFSVEIELDKSSTPPDIKRVALLRTARLLMRGEVLIPEDTNA
ncbi:4-oxalomesaconate tautomerase [Haliea sp. AH-315-K21]|uniref:4-oxalomesaconate tautomerase n=1 Tax=SAR86 cluster bacterium TaxID=2030880 RepID=A0A2A5CAG3_9GAMM|nr:4-oxalomesaconate tautomerase [Haliea sp. AH-315-K21]PCJ40346.1 MAG: 4-oxalomesaconate tautomerase [SAR86 cluster bacterium]